MTVQLSEPADVALVRKYAQTETVTKIRRADPWKGAAASPTVVSVIRNERARLPDFLHHHRCLGVQRFALIDNASRDGTTEYLRLQPDVDLFSASAPFEWRRKHGWIMQVIQQLGLHRWYLLLDADEHVVYANSETQPIQDLIATLEARGVTRVRGALVDMYAKGPITAQVTEPGDRVSDRYPYFDAATYHEHLTARTGGPRGRLLSSMTSTFTPALTKYPLFRLGNQDVAYNPHAIWPPTEHAEDPCLIALKHYKFDEGFFDKISYALETKVYWNDSSEYALYQAAIEKDAAFSLYFHGSRRFESSLDFLAHDVISAIEPLDQDDDLVRQIRKASRRRLADLMAKSNV